MDCPSPQQLYELAHGTLEPARRGPIAAHVAVCSSCQRGVAHARESSGGGAPQFALADALEPRHSSDPRASTVSLGPSLDPDVDENSATMAWDSGPSSFTPGSMPGSVTGHSELTRGTPVGRYLIVEPLGSGGLGDVYTAYDPELDRCVAIKVLRPSTDDVEGSHSGSGSGRDRLLREAKALARLSHPNVVAVYDVGSVGDDVFIAMERVDGVTLSRWSKAQKRPWREIRDVFLGIGAGVAAAHDAGIVHRDLKPQNVIVSPDGRPRVLDFGLARALQGNDDRSGLLLIANSVGKLATSSRDSLDDSITMAGTVMGTPQYMAPEQFDEEGTIGAAADQFSFCVALWQALYGKRPFQGNGMIEIVQAARAGRFVEPSDRRGVPKWLHKAMLRGLQTDPAKRFESMHALMHALQRDRRSRRAQWIALVVVAVLSAAGAGTLAFVLRPPVTDEHRDGVEALAQEAQAAAARSYYVYPDPDDPEGVTAYRKVLALEELVGPAADIADERAGQLRAEFSDTLTRLGDRYYEYEGGQAFAADYYAAALVFDPDNEHARGRTTLTPGELASLRKRAASGEFSAGELAASASLAVLAIEDEMERRDQLLALYAGAQAPSPSTSARLEALLGDEDVEAIARAAEKRRPARRRAAKAKAEPEPEAKAEPSESSAEANDDSDDEDGKD